MSSKRVKSFDEFISAFSIKKTLLNFLEIFVWSIPLPNESNEFLLINSLFPNESNALLINSLPPSESKFLLMNSLPPNESKFLLINSLPPNESKFRFINSLSPRESKYLLINSWPPLVIKNQHTTKLHCYSNQFL